MISLLIYKFNSALLLFQWSRIHLPPLQNFLSHKARSLSTNLRCHPWILLWGISSLYLYSATALQAPVYLMTVYYSCCSVMSNSLQPQGLQHTRPFCPPLSLRVCSNSCPLTQWCYLTFSSPAIPLLLLPSVFPNIRIFYSESAVCIKWQKYWRFRFNHNPSNKYSGLISFRIVGFTSLQIQGTLKSLLQQHNSKSSILLCSVFFMVQHTYPYMTERKTVFLTIRTFVHKAMSLLLNMLSMLVIALFPRSIF